MDFLKAEIAKKRKAEAEAEASAGSGPGTGTGASSSSSPDASAASSSKQPTSSPPPSKYVRRGDVQRQREEEARREQEAKRKEKARLAALKEEDRRSRSSRSRTPEADPSSDTTTSAGLAAAAAAVSDARKETFNISPAEAARRLRAKGEPVRLFGESDKETRLRLRALELIEERGEKMGQNDFMRALAGAESGVSLEQLERERIQKGKEGRDHSGQGQDASKDDARVDASPEKKSSRRTGEGIGMNSLLDLDLIRKDMPRVYPIIYYTLKGLLDEWAASLAERPLDVKMSTAGRTASAIQVQSADYLKPLFKSLRKRELPPDVLMRIAEIVHYVQKRQYRNANDSYLQLSIGNAPWPIGVTMVGIHERSGREKIFASNVAHVLNDEVSRKYIQSLKRLMTFAQTKYPPSDVSMLMG